MTAVLSPTRPATSSTFELHLEAHRRELTGYCYRMLGSGSEAEDAVQETMVRAWRKGESLQAQAALRRWLLQIATNVCLDMLRTPQRRARPMDLGPASTAEGSLGAGLPETTWIMPIDDGRVVPSDGDPAAAAEARETIRLAFVAALQHLPPKQRAVLVLREVLRFSAVEVAELLDTSVAGVNSALQRARATLDAVDHSAPPVPLAAREAELLDRYVDAFVRYDVPALKALLTQDATFSMPPWALWLQGPEEIGKWFRGQGAGCEGSVCQKLRLNGQPAYAQWKPDGAGGFQRWSITVLTVAGDAITDVIHFIYPGLFDELGLVDP